MRKEIYKMLCERLGNIPEIKYIDLWNHNVEFIEQEDNWERPAVFVELCPINWEATVAGMRYVTEAKVNLHVVTDWLGSSAANSDQREECLTSWKRFTQPWQMWTVSISRSSTSAIRQPTTTMRIFWKTLKLIVMWVTENLASPSKYN